MNTLVSCGIDHSSRYSALCLARYFSVFSKLFWYLTFAHRSLSYETSFLETIGAIEHRDRVAGLISVGGSTRAWQSMALEGLQATMFTTDMKVVDMMLATRVPAPAQCLLDDKLMARARAMGEHIMQAVATPAEERRWLGEEDMGWCPNCHSNALVLGEMQWDGLHYPEAVQTQRPGHRGHRPPGRGVPEL